MSEKELLRKEDFITLLHFLKTVLDLEINSGDAGTEL